MDREVTWSDLRLSRIILAAFLRVTYLGAIIANPEEGMATHSSVLAWRIPVERGAWQATVHQIAKCRTQLSEAQHIANPREVCCSWTNWGNSLVVQRLRLWTFTAKGWGAVSDWGTKIPRATRHSQKLKNKKIKKQLCCVCLVTQSCPTLWPVDCSPPGSSVHGDSPGKNTGVGSHALLQGIFPTQKSNQGLLHWIRYQLSYQGNPKINSIRS